MEKQFLQSVVNEIVKSIFEGSVYTDANGREQLRDPKINYILPDLVTKITPKVIEDVMKKIDLEDVKEKIIKNFHDKFETKEACQNYPTDIRNELQGLYSEIGKMEINLLQEKKAQMQKDLGVKED